MQLSGEPDQDGDRGARPSDFVIDQHLLRKAELPSELRLRESRRLGSLGDAPTEYGVSLASNERTSECLLSTNKRRGVVTCYSYLASRHLHFKSLIT